jgi:alpha-glucosidase
MARTPRIPCVLGPALAAALLFAGLPGRLPGQVRVASPDARNQVTVEVREGRLYYGLTRDGRELILPSLLGFEFRGATARDGLRIPTPPRRSHDEWWTQPRGEVARCATTTTSWRFR